MTVTPYPRLPSPSPHLEVFLPSPSPHLEVFYRHRHPIWCFFTVTVTPIPDQKLPSPSPYLAKIFFALRAIFLPNSLYLPLEYCKIFFALRAIFLPNSLYLPLKYRKIFFALRAIFLPNSLYLPLKYYKIFLRASREKLLYPYISATKITITVPLSSFDRSQQPELPSPYPSTTPELPSPYPFCDPRITVTVTKILENSQNYGHGTPPPHFRMGSIRSRYPPTPLLHSSNTPENLYGTPPPHFSKICPFFYGIRYPPTPP